MQKLVHQIYSFDEFTLDVTRGSYRRGVEEIKLRPKSFDVLKYLVENNGRLISKDELIQAVWTDTAVTDDSLVQCLKEIRHALGDEAQQIIKTVPRRGYIFEKEVSENGTTYTEETTGIHIVIEESEERNYPDVIETAMTRSGSYAPLNADGISAQLPDEKFVHGASTVEATSAQTESRTVRLVKTFKRHKRATALALASFVLIGGGLAFGLFYFFRLPPVSPFNSVSIRQLTIDDNVVIAAISPDGNFVVYATEKDGRQSLWVRQVAATGGKEIVEPADVEYTGLTFSPDGNFVYFVRGRTIFERQTLYQIPAFGGATRKLFDDVRSAAAVSPDGKRIAFVRGPDLILANADGTGEPQILATRKPPEEFFLAYWDSGLDWSPDGKTIAISGGDTHKIKEMYPILVNVADGTQTLLTKNGWQGVGRVTWLADGSGIVMNAVDRQIDTTSQLWHVSYPGGAATRIYNDFNGYDSVSLATNSDTLAAVQSEAQTNLRAINPSEEAGKITDLTVGKGRNDGYWQLATAPDGRIVFDSKAGGEMELWIMDADGGNQKQLNAPKAHEPTVSPDASRIVFNARAGIWQMEIDGSNQRELTKTGMFPYYSPDGQWIFYTGPPRGFRLWKMRSDGSEPTQVTDYPAIQPAVSPDGKMIAFMALTGKTEAKLKIIRIEGGETVREFEVVQLRRPFQIEWTHGGTAVNYNGFSDGVEQIWNLPLDGSPPRVLFETKTGQIRSFTWSPDGKRLYFGSGPVSRNVVIFSLSR